MVISIKATQHPVETESFTKEFAECWQAVGVHIQYQAQQGGFLQPPPKGEFSWHKAELHPPFMEHFSFRLGNQVYFICIEDVDGRLQIPGTRESLFRIAEGWGGHPCLMPMQMAGGKWRPAHSGWGLVNAKTGLLVDPPVLMTNELIALTDWELHDFAINMVCNDLINKGHRIMSYSSDPDVNPSLWFIGTAGPEWVVVRAAMYPPIKAEPPANMTEIMLACKPIAKKGHFASVAFNNVEDMSKPLYRGQAANFEYEGLEEFTG